MPSHVEIDQVLLRSRAEMCAAFKSRPKRADAAFAWRSFSMEQQRWSAILLRPAHLSEFLHHAEITPSEAASRNSLSWERKLIAKVPPQFITHK